MRIRTTAIAFVVCSLLSSSLAMAQQHVVDPAAMRQAIAAQAATDQQNRDLVLKVLGQSQVRDLAARFGLDVTRATGAVATMTSADLARLAVPARTAEAQLAGGDTVTISVTTLLLIIIIVILVTR